MKCDGKPDAAIGDGQVCVDTGIRSESLFSFANWANRRYKGDDFGLPEMIALYGQEKVCTDPAAAECQVTPKARVLQTAINNMLMNGRCEGLTVLGALYMASRGPSPETFGADSVGTLTPVNVDFANVIDYWWGSQFMSGTLEESKSVRKSGVTAVLASVIEGLGNARGVTVGLYSKEGAHSVLPVAVARDTAGSFIVLVWDPNTPRNLGRIAVDPAKKTWRYEGGRENPQDEPEVWSGGDGTIDVNTLDSRKGDPTMKIGDGQRGDATVLASAPSTQSVSLTVRTSGGQELVATTTGTTGAIPGAVVTPLKNGDGEQVLVTLPAGTGDYSVSMDLSGKTETNASSTGDARLTVEDGSTNAFSVSSPVGKEPAGSIKVDTKSGPGDVPEFSASTSGESAVTAAAGSSVISLALFANTTVQLRGSTEQGTDATLLLTDATGATRSTVIPQASEGNAAQEVVVTTTATGQLKATSAPLAAVAIDSAKLKGIISASDGKDPAVSAGLQPSSQDAVSADVRSSLSKVGADNATISTTVTSGADAAAWVEYGPDLDWGTVLKSEQVQVKANTADPVVTVVKGLSNGTKYRFRSAVLVNGLAKYTAWNQFVTSGDGGPTPTTLPPEPVDVTSSSGNISETAATISWKVTPLSIVSTWIEYSPVDQPNNMRGTPEQVAQANKTTSFSVDLRGLADNTTFRYRVAMSVRGRLVRSEFQEFTTLGKKVFTPASEPKITVVLQAEQTSETGALLVVTTTSQVNAAVILTYGTTTPSNSAEITYAAAGENVRTEIPVLGLGASTAYVAKVVVRSPQQNEYTANTTFSTSQAFSVLSDPVVSAVTLTAAEFTTAVSRGINGTARFEYGINNTAIETSPTGTVSVTTSTTSVRMATSPSKQLSPGTGYRVRAVISTSYGDFTSRYVVFTSQGTMNLDTFIPAAPTVTAMAPGLYIHWTLNAKDTPTNLTFRVFDGSDQLCSTTNAAWACTITTANPVIRTGIYVVSYLDGVEVRRSTTTVALTP